MEFPACASHHEHQVSISLQKSTIKFDSSSLQVIFSGKLFFIDCSSEFRGLGLRFSTFLEILKQQHTVASTL